MRRYRWGATPIDLPTVHLVTILTAFATIFVAELPDKTMLATIVLSARYRRPWPVWFGAAGALAVQMVIASATGGLLNQLPEAPVRLAIAVLFLVGAEAGPASGQGERFGAGVAGRRGRQRHDLLDRPAGRGHPRRR